MTSEVRIPDIGDAEDVEVIEVCVALGDTVAENDALIVIESDKASMEVPSPFAGKIEQIHVALGDVVNQGDLIVTLEVEEAAQATVDAGAAVDNGAEADATTESETAPQAPAAPAAPRPKEAPSIDVVASGARQAPPPASSSGGTEGPGASIYAGPAVRRLARELGVDLVQVTGTGAKGRIVKDDVKAYVKTTLSSGPSVPGAPTFNLDFSRFGEVETVPLTRVQARGAANLAKSWQAVVHVTEHDEADVTDLEAFRTALKAEAAQRDVKLTPLPFIMKACAHNLAAHPRFNASLDAEARALIVKKFVNIGFAVDTEQGLLVPVVRDVDQKGIWQLAEEIAELSEAARNQRLKPEQLMGGCFTISSLGAIGGTGFTPIVNAPEVAILGVARLDTKPVWDGSQFIPRLMLPLSLSYDHRAINGAEAGRFLFALGQLLTDFRRLTL